MHRIWKQGVDSQHVFQLKWIRQSGGTPYRLVKARRMET